MSEQHPSHFLGHLRYAFLVGAIISLLHAFGLLGWMDAVMLTSAGHAQVSDRSPPAPSDLPLVMLISPKMYEQTFEQSSPLNRKKLAQLIDQIPKSENQKPRLVAVDLDLSPTHRAGECPQQAPTCPDNDQALLDSTLKKLSDSGISLILAMPLRSSTQEWVSMKYDWMQTVCNQSVNGNIDFALTQTHSHFGQVIQYAHNTPSLGVVAATAQVTARICQQVRDVEDDGAERERLKQALLSSAFDDRAVVHQSHGELMLKPFNSHFFTHGDAHVVVINDLRTLSESAQTWTGRTVFVGGAFDERDYFTMPMEPGSDHKVEGVVVHAAAYFSEKNRVSDYPYLAFFIDVSSGVFLAYVFGATLRPYQQASSPHGNAVWASYLKTRAIVLCNLILVVALIWISMYLAYRCAYPTNIWINPGPVIIGVFAKFLIAAAHGRHHEMVSKPAWLETLLLVAIALFAIHINHH